jgi:hypothetical protein
MLWAVFLVLLIMWLLAIASAYTIGGFIHMLLGVAAVVLLMQTFGGRRVS